MTFNFQNVLLSAVGQPSGDFSKYERWVKDSRSGDSRSGAENQGLWFCPSASRPRTTVIILSVSGGIVQRFLSTAWQRCRCGDVASVDDGKGEGGRERQDLSTCLKSVISLREPE